MDFSPSTKSAGRKWTYRVVVREDAWTSSPASIQARIPLAAAAVAIVCRKE